MATAALDAAPEAAKLAELSPLPAFIAHRQGIWDTVKSQYDQAVQAKTPVAISIETFDKVRRLAD